MTKQKRQRAARKREAACSLLSDTDLVRQGAEAAARAKMFLLRTIDANHYSVLQQRLEALADRMDVQQHRRKTMKKVWKTDWRPGR